VLIRHAVGKRPEAEFDAGTEGLLKTAKPFERSFNSIEVKALNTQILEVGLSSSSSQIYDKVDIDNDAKFYCFLAESVGRVERRLVMNRLTPNLVDDIP
jgi:hypothetical protein